MPGTGNAKTGTSRPASGGVAPLTPPKDEKPPVNLNPTPDEKQRLKDVRERLASLGVSLDKNLASKLDIDNLTMTVEQMERLVNTYNFNFDMMTGIVPETKADAYASMSINALGFQKLWIDPNSFGHSKEALEKGYQYMVDIGASPANSHASDIIWHELGHYVENEIFKKVFPRSAGTFYTKEQIDSFQWNLVKEAYNNLHPDDKITAQAFRESSHGDKIGSGISTYAKTDPGECFAEAWVDYHVNGENAAPMSKEIYRMIKKYL